MTVGQILKLTLWLAREVARLHASNAALQAVIEELRLIEPQLAPVRPDLIQIDQWQKFYEALEDLDPEIAALLDNRPPRAFGTGEHEGE